MSKRMTHLLSIGKPIVQSASFRRHLARDGAEAFKAHKRIEEFSARQRWWRPVVGLRKAKVARKQAIVNGTYGSFDEENGGWLPEWDHVREPRILRPPKRHKRERTRAARAAKIVDKMKEMPAKIAAYRKEVVDRKPTPGIETTLRLLSKR